MKLESSNRLKSMAMPAGLAAMETCWVYPWAVLVGVYAWTGEGIALLSPVSIFGLLLGGHLVTRAVLRRDYPLRLARAVIALLGALAVLLALRIDYTHQLPPLGDPAWLVAILSTFPNSFDKPSAIVPAAILGLLLWWKGVAGGRSRTDSWAVERSFKIGCFAMVGFLLLTIMMGSAAEAALQSQVAFFVVAYFFVGFTSLAMARIDDIRRQSSTRGQPVPAFNRHWLGFVLATVTALLLAATALAQAISFDLIIAVAAPVLSFLGPVCEVLIFVIVLPIGLLVEGLVWLFRLLFHPGEPPQLPANDMSFLERLQEGPGEGALAGLPPELVLAVKWLAVTLVAISVLYALTRLVFRFRQAEREDGVVEERDSVWTWALAASFLLSLLQRLHRRIFGKRKVVAPAPEGVARTGGEEVTLTTTVRQVYRHLLQLGASAGITRAAHTTPYEHLPQLLGALEPEEDVAAITDAYVRARYGPGSPPEAELEDLRLRWRRVAALTELEAGTGDGDRPERYSDHSQFKPR